MLFNQYVNTENIVFVSKETLWSTEFAQIFEIKQEMSTKFCPGAGCLDLDFQTLKDMSS